MKLLTLAIAAYNMEQYLPHCLDSVVTAKHANWLDVIVINDGSHDSTSAIAHLYEERHSGVVRVIDQPNGNYGTCINRALSCATGRYFRPLDADDQLDTTALDETLTRMISCEADLIITPYLRTSGDTVLSRVGLPATIETSQNYRATQTDFATLGLETLVSMHSMTYRTALLRDIKLQLQSGISYTDTEYCMLPLDQIQTIRFFDITLYHYQQGRQGQTMQRQNIVRSIHSLYTLSCSLSTYYMQHASHNNAIIRANQRCFLRRVLYYFSIAALVFDSSEDNLEMLRQLTLHLRPSQELSRDFSRFTYHGIPYVWLWQKLHIQVFRWINRRNIDN